MEASSNLADARASGNHLYHGRVCKRCTSTVRYTLSGNCKSCDKKRQQSPYAVQRRKAPAARNYQRNKLAVKDYQLQHKYGITLVDYNIMLESQGGVCKICRLAAKQLCVDHCHTTGKVRGLLCHGCNRGIGLLKESKQNFLAAIEYLYGPQTCGASKEVPE